MNGGGGCAEWTQSRDLKLNLRKGGPEEILAGLATAVQPDTPRGNSSHEVNGQQKSVYS